MQIWKQRTVSIYSAVWELLCKEMCYAVTLTFKKVIRKQYITTNCWFINHEHILWLREYFEPGNRSSSFGVLLETPMDISLETPIWTSRWRHPYFHWRHPDFHWRLHIFVGDPQILVGDRHIFIGDPMFLVEDPQIFIGYPQIFIGYPRFSVETIIIY